MSLKKSTDSDEVSFDHILKQIDRNDEQKMKKLESYNYGIPQDKKNSQSDGKGGK